MPLEKAVVEVALTQGLDTRTDKRLVIPGKLLRLENGYFQGATVAKRPGSVPLPMTTLAGGTLASGEALATLGNELLHFSNATGLWAFSASLQRWAQRGAADDARQYNTRLTRVYRGSSGATEVDCAVSGNLACFSWLTVAGAQYHVRSAVVDMLTGAVVRQGDDLFTTSGGVDPAPRLVAVTGYFVLLYRDAATTTLYCRTLSTSAPTAWSAAVSMTATAAASAFDAVADGAEVVLAYGTAANAFALRRLTFPAGVPTAGAATAVASGGSQALSVALLGTNVFCFYNSNTAPFDAQCRTFSSAFASLTGGAAITVAAATPALWFSAASLDGGATMTVLLDAGPIRKATLSTTAVTVAAAVWVRGVFLAGRIFSLGGRYLAPVYHVANVGTYPAYTSQTVQPTAFVLDVATGDVVANAIRGSAAVLAGSSFIGSVLRLPGNGAVLGQAVLPLLEKGRPSVTGGGFMGAAVDSTPLGVSALVLSATTTRPHSEFARTLHVGGASPQLVDDGALVEDGFPLALEKPTLSTTGAAGSLSAGTYQVCLVLEWFDAKGNRHQSVPSVPASIVAAANDRINITAFTLKLTRKANSRQAPALVEYRTEANGTLFYRVSPLSTPNLNDATVESVALQDGLADASLITGEVLYTTGGVLEYLPPPPHYFSWTQGKRLMVLPNEDRQAVRYSLEDARGEAASFHEALELRVPDAAGELTAGASIDGKCVLFTNSDIFVVAGDGPNDAGQQNTFSEPQSLQSDVGCLSAATLVEVPAGLMFQSAKGVYLLTRGLELQYVGADVEAYNSATFYRAVLHETQQQVRFLTSAGTLVYDYQQGQWARWPEALGIDATMLGASDFYRLTSGGKVLQDDAVTFTEDGANYSLLLETSWLKLQGLQGFQRVYRALLLGEFVSACTLTVEAFYDYVETAVDTVSTSLTSANQPDGKFQVEHRFSVQKAEAVKLRVTVAAAGEGVNLTSLALECGLKRGLRKLSASRRA